MAMSTFFKIFPPPLFINAPYGGISISDDAVQCIQFSPTSHGQVISKYSNKALPPGIVEAGHVMDEARLTAFIAGIAKEHGLSFVKASLPEEKIYLFKTPIPANADSAAIVQSIEFKLEENVPMPAAEAIFCFEAIPGTLVENKNTASVLVAPRKAVETYLNVLTNAGLTVLCFEMAAQALSKSIVEKDSQRTILIIHIMNHKAGVYVVHQGVVCFSSTIQLGDDAIGNIHKEVMKVYDYWGQHGEGKKEIEAAIVCGASALAARFMEKNFPLPIHVELANVWQNIFSDKEYIPAVTFEESLEYAVAAGLAIPSEQFS